MYVFHHLQLPTLFAISSHQVPRGGRAGGGESPKHSRKKKWKVGGREYFLLYCLSPSNKLCFALVICLWSHLKPWYLLPRWTEMWKYEKQLEGGYIWEAAAAHSAVETNYRKRMFWEVIIKQEGDSVLKNVFTACLILLKILPVLQSLCSAEC